MSTSCGGKEFNVLYHNPLKTYWSHNPGVFEFTKYSTLLHDGGMFGYKNNIDLMWLMKENDHVPFFSVD